MSDRHTQGNSEPETEDTRSFVDRWIDKNIEDDDLDSEMVDLIDEHRSGNDLDESLLLNALIKYADQQSSKENG